MIKTKEDLCFYLKEDFKRYKITPKWWKMFGGSEVYPIFAFFKNLRYLEYYTNNRIGIFNRILYYYYLFVHNHKRLRCSIYVAPNVFGPGVLFVHPGFLRADDFVSIGSNCTILPNVLFGKKSPGLLNPNIILGDNVYVSTNVTILGPIKIGNNVVIGAGAVVTKDVPDNVTIGGVPAKILKKDNE